MATHGELTAMAIVGTVGEHVTALGAAFPAGTLKNGENQKKVPAQLTQAAEEISSLGIQI
jgi:DNA-binding IclR family transcriptional regulator